MKHSHEEIQLGIINIMRKVKGQDILEVGLKADLREDMDFDSLDIIEILYDCEMRYSIRVTDDEMQSIRTFEDLVNLVGKKQYA